MNKTKLILLSGFLGAGKTTLMLAAAEQLRKQGVRAACVTNDQGGNLVDSRLVLLKELPLEQIEGGCFCCRFEDLVDSINRIIDQEQPEVILAEAVGSCTDLVATVVKPLQQFHGDRIDVRPLSVVVDPERWAERLSGTSPFTGEIAYLYGKQLEEAQCLVLNKADLLTEERKYQLHSELDVQYAKVAVLALSSFHPDEVDIWLSYIMHAEQAVLPAVEVDYDIYARGEAQLGWLNAHVSFRGLILNAGAFASELTDLLTGRFGNQEMEIAHFKLWAQNGKDSLKLSAVRNASGLRLDHTSSRDWKADELTMLINARVNGSDQQLRDTVTSGLSELSRKYGIDACVERMDCFAPAYPTPVYRMV
jgi:hypothetical protein